MSNQLNNTAISLLTRDAVTVDSVGSGLNPKKASAQMRQVTHREYPSARVGSSNEDSIFDKSDFGFSAQKYSSTRMAWMDVPLGTTAEQVIAKLASLPNAGIQQMLSDTVILTAEQISAISAGLTTEDIVKYGTSGNGGQVVRYGKNNTEGKGEFEKVPGPTGKEQFKANYFRLDVIANPDQDSRQPKAVVAPNTPAVYGGREETATPRFSVVDAIAQTSATTPLPAGLDF